jgi:ADP-heptose:LPS heptosyltransferase
LTTPLFAALRAGLAGARIHVLANDYNAWVVAGNPDIERIWTYPRTRHAGRLRLGAAIAQLGQLFALRRERFDVAIAAGGDESPRAIGRALAAGAGRTIAYASAATRYGGRLSDPQPPPAYGHEIERMLRLALPLGVALPTPPSEPCFTLPAAWRADAGRWLAAQGFAAGAYVVIGLGARDVEKQPTAAQVLRWAARLQHDFGCATALQFTPGDRRNALYPGSEALAREIGAAAPWWLKLLPPQLPTVLGVIDGARTSLLPDGGLMHLAAAAPGGVVGLFAQPGRLSDPVRWGPVGPRAAALTAPQTIAELTDDEVLDALAPRLGAGRSD